MIVYQYLEGRSFLSCMVRSKQHFLAFGNNADKGQVETTCYLRTAFHQPVTVQGKINEIFTGQQIEEISFPQANSRIIVKLQTMKKKPTKDTSQNDADTTSDCHMCQNVELDEGGKSLGHMIACNSLFMKSAR